MSAVASLTIASRRLRRPGGVVLPWKTFQLRTSTATSLRACASSWPILPRSRLRTTTSSRPLSCARGRGRACHVALPLRRRTRARGLRAARAFYPLSSRLFGRSRLRLPLKALEHPLGLARLTATRADVVHLQWLSAPEVDVLLLATARRSCSRRTTCCPGGPDTGDLWTRVFDRFDRIVVHSTRGRETLASFGVPEEKLRVISHPVSPSNPRRSDDGRDRAHTWG